MYTKCFENFATEDEYNYHWENNHPVVYTARWKCYLCGMDFVKRFERPVHNATEHPDAPIFTPHDSLGDLWHRPVNLPRATKQAPMSQVASKNEHTAPSSPPLSPEETPWKAK